MKTSKTISLIIVLLIIVAAIAFIEMNKVGGGVVVVGDDIASSTPIVNTVGATSSRAAIIAQKELEYPRAKEIVDPTGFINTPGGLPITISQYIGKKVILIDFWTYSCINCQRTIPYLNDWYTKYEGKGFVIIGIHTPEFDFEKDINNVKAAVQKFGIQYPVVLDSNMGTWNAYGNMYWPHEYLIDIDGFIREDHIGEGGYSDTENMIQQLLIERAQALGLSTDGIATATVSDPADQMQNISDETYFGAYRNQTFGNGTPGQTGTQIFALPSTFSQDTFYLGGNWDVEQQYAVSAGTDTLVFPYTAKHVYIVASSTLPTDVTVKVDGEPLGNLSGADVVTKNGQSVVTISGARLYDLIDDTAVNSHTLEIDIPKPGVDVFTFTFGS